MERSINTLTKTIKSMDSPLKLAQTRLKKRKRQIRRGIERGRGLFEIIELEENN